MTQLDLHVQRDRLKNWISMLAIFPADSVEGKRRDEFWGKALELELKTIERRLQIKRMGKTVNALCGLTNKLRELIR